MTTYPNMQLTLPTRGAAGSGLWGDTEDANTAKVDAHDHSTGKGVRVPTAGMNINADLPFSALYAPTQLHRVQFSSIAVGGLTGSNVKSLFVSDGTGGLVANELYWRTNTSNSVQITAGNALNVGAFAGLIGGDYTAVGAQLNYNDTAKAYEFKEGVADSNQWARLRSGDLRLSPFNTSSAFFVGQAAPGGLAGSYTMTWPTALPGSAQSVSVDNTGAMAFGASQALASGNSYTVSGAGLYKHGIVTENVPVLATGAGTTGSGLGGVPVSATLNGTGVASLYMTDVVPVGARIVNIRAKVLDEVGSTITLRLATKTMSALTAPSWTNQGGSQASAGNATIQLLTVSSINYTVQAFTEVAVELLAQAATGASKAYVIEIDYDQP